MEAVLLWEGSMLRRTALMLFRMMRLGMPALMALLDWVTMRNVKWSCQWSWVVW